MVVNTRPHLILDKVATTVSIPVPPQRLAGGQYIRVAFVAVVAPVRLAITANTKVSRDSVSTAPPLQGNATRLDINSTRATGAEYISAAKFTEIVNGTH